MKAKGHSRLLIHALICLTLLLCSATTAFAQTPTLHANGKIAFSYYSYTPCCQDGQSGIAVMNPDGSGRTPLTSSPFRCPQLNRLPGSCGPDHYDGGPSWSPDGKEIAFIRMVPTPNLGFESDLFVMDADGSNQRRLTQTGSAYPTVTWSPDGTKLAFVSGYPNGIYVMNADGSNQHPVGPGQSPAWSPDGSKLAFKADGGLYVMNPDGSGRAQITAPQSPYPFYYDDDLLAGWSPDSRRILFIRRARCDWDGNCESTTPWTVNADGSNPAKLSDIATDGLAWSPDGTKIVFVSGDLFTMDSDGSNITRLTNTPYDDHKGEPSWQPLAPIACASANPIDCPDFFISQQYRDFLAREPEPSCPPGQCGLDFYLPILNGCAASDTECTRYTRGALSANFFRAPEFQAKGSYVMYLYLVAIGQRPLTVAELQDASKVERPHYTEFMADMAAISSPNDRNGPDPAKKAALTQDFVQRAEVVAKYPTASYPTMVSFGNALAATAGVTLSSQTQNLIAAATTRAQVLQIVAESSEVNDKFYKPAFVTMEYFGYLRRDPEDCHDSANWWGTGDPNACGYIFHNNRFNTLPLDPDLIQNFIVRGFIESPEYRHRFGP